MQAQTVQSCGIISTIGDVWEVGAVRVATVAEDIHILPKSLHVWWLREPIRFRKKFEPGHRVGPRRCDHNRCALLVVGCDWCHGGKAEDIFFGMWSCCRHGT